MGKQQSGLDIEIPDLMELNYTKFRQVWLTLYQADITENSNWALRPVESFLTPLMSSLERHQQKIDSWNLTHIFSGGHQYVRWVNVKICPIEVFIAGDRERIRQIHELK